MKRYKITPILLCIPIHLVVSFVYFKFYHHWTDMSLIAVLIILLEILLLTIVDRVLVITLFKSRYKTFFTIETLLIAIYAIANITHFDEIGEFLLHLVYPLFAIF